MCEPIPDTVAPLLGGPKGVEMGAEKKRKTNIIDSIYDIYLSLGPAGLSWEAVPEALAEVRREFLTKTFKNLTNQHLHAILRAWRDWLAFHKTAPEQFVEPSAMDLAIFLKEMSSRGPSVAPARLRAFTWLREPLGLTTCLGHSS